MPSWSIPPKCVSCMRQRYVVCVLGMSGMMVAALSQNSCHQAIREMVIQSNHDRTNKIEPNKYCVPYSPGGSTPEIREYAEFYWEPMLVRSLSHSFYIGFLVSQVAGGLVADRCGPRHVWGSGLLLSSVATLLWPSLARLNVYVLITGCLLQGMGQGLAMPCASVVVAHWVPVTERSIFTALIESGTFIGWILVYFLHIKVRVCGWEGWLYISGVLGIVWCVAWYTLFHNSPAHHPHISPSENTLLQRQVEGIEHKFRSVKNVWKPFTPWRHILSSLPFLSLLVINLANEWLQLMLFIQILRYFKDVLQISISSRLSLTGLVLCPMIPSAIVHAIASDWLIAHHHMSRTTNRRLFSVLANYLPLPFLLTVSGWGGCNKVSVVIKFVLIVYFHSLAYGTLRAGPVDLSPQHSGVLMALLNSFGAVAALFSRQLVHILIDDDSADPMAWDWFFSWTAVVLLVLPVPYMYFGSGNIQPWNSLPKKANKDSLQMQAQPSKAMVTTMLPDNS